MCVGAGEVEREERGGSKESEPLPEGADREREGVEGRECWDWREGVTGRGSREDVELRPIRQGVVLLVMRGMELWAITEGVVLLVIRGVEQWSIREGVVLLVRRGVELRPGNEGVELLLLGVTHLSG